MNILRAAHLAMCRALAALPSPSCYALIDGNLLPRDLPCPGRAIVKGDALCLSIAAASVIAKVTRDRYMRKAAEHYPSWNFAGNVGYSTPDHREAIAVNGICVLHRRSFASTAYLQLELGA